MTVKMTPEMEKLVEAKIQEGEFDSPEEVILAGLLSLAHNDDEDFGAPEHLRVTSVERLRELLAEGERSIKEEGTLDGDEAFAQRQAERAKARERI